MTALFSTLLVMGLCPIPRPTERVFQTRFTRSARPVGPRVGSAPSPAPLSGFFKPASRPSGVPWGPALALAKHPAIPNESGAAKLLTAELSR